MVTSITSDRIIDERYQIVTTIGHGGMGTVYLVVDLEKNRQVALKTLESGLSEQTSWGRFEREARNASRLNHPNIARIYDFGMLNDHIPYLVMEMVAGQSLHDRIKAKGPLSEEEALTVFGAMASALTHAHQMDTIHRDIKPGNIVLLTDKVGKIVDAKLIDFGLAKCFADNEFAQSLTATGEIIGSPFYMSPEYWNGESLGPGSDLYSLGITLYEAFTGDVPFIGKNPLATAVLHNTEPVPQLSAQTTNLIDPADWQKVLDKMLAKSFDQRYRNAEQFAYDLNCIALGDEIEPLQALQEESAANGSAAIKWLIAVLAFLVICGLASLLFSHHKAPAIGHAIKNDFDTILNSTDTTSSVAGARFTVFANGNQKIFNFPEKFAIGTFDDGDSSKAAIARGKLTVSAKADLTFHPTDFVVQHPDVLKDFGPNDLWGLYIQGSPAEITDEGLRNIEHMTSLKLLDVRNCAITNQAISTINRLPELTHLALVDTEITPVGLTKMANLPKLHSLTINESDTLEPLLLALHHSKLSHLTLKNDKLLDRDLLSISQLKHLTALSLNGNDKLTARGISYLASCPKLELLHIEKIPLDAKCIPALASLHHLRYLNLSPDHFSETEIKALKAALPCCQISMDEGFRHF